MNAPDLANARRFIVALTGVQTFFLAVVLAFFLMSGAAGGRGALRYAWLALLPLALAAWGFLYLRGLRRAAAAGPDAAAYRDVNRKAVRALGAIGVAWTIGLVAVLLVV